MKEVCHQLYQREIFIAWLADLMRAVLAGYHRCILAVMSSKGDQPRQPGDPDLHVESFVGGARRQGGLPVFSGGL